MRKTVSLDGNMLGRRAGKAKAALEIEHGLAMQILLHSPKDLAAAAVALAAVVAIIVNALLMQAGRHPSPMFGSNFAEPATVASQANPLPRPRPSDAAPRLAEFRIAEPKPAEIKPVEPIKVAAALHASAAAVVRPPASIPVSSRSDPLGDLITSSRRVAAVQRALTEYGYGQLKPTGTVGTDTQAAILRFERDRKIPATGQLSDRLVRELSVVTGKAID